MSLSTLVRSTILNGANSIAVAVRNGIVYRLQPIETMKEIRFHNFEPNKPRIFHLNDELTEDYKIVGVTVDFPEDDDQVDEDKGSMTQNMATTAYVRIINKNKASENIRLTLSSYPMYINKLYLNHNDTLKIMMSKRVNKITFRCVPVIIEKATNFS